MILRKLQSIFQHPRATLQVSPDSSGMSCRLKAVLTPSTWRPNEICLKKKATAYMLKISLALSNDAWIRQHPVWQTERSSEELYKARGFLGRWEQGQGSCTWKKVDGSLQSYFPIGGWQRSIRWFLIGWFKMSFLKQLKLSWRLS